MEVRGTPVNLNGRTSGTPGPAPANTGNFMRVVIPVPPGRSPAVTSTFARMLVFKNVDATNDIQIYYDPSGGDYVTIAKGTERTLYGNITSFVIRSAGAAAAQWEATAIVAA